MTKKVWICVSVHFKSQGKYEWWEIIEISAEEIFESFANCILFKWAENTFEFVFVNCIVFNYAEKLQSRWIGKINLTEWLDLEY